MHFDIEDLVAEGTTVVCIGVMSGTLYGVPATDRPTAARHVHILTFNPAGLVIDHLAVREGVALLRQLGVLPPTRVQACRARDAAVPAPVSEPLEDR